ncbi:uncharacterized protein LOC135831846 isoform X3 [Planococcus citri]|uniref:uncharacterized protein LOC135831846 isoform X3 n=1 Tax=Planococcus citri TaxID=170843 RepID=UPI0031F79BB4
MMVKLNKGGIMKNILMATVFTLFFTLDCSLAEETQNPSKEDIILLIEKIDKILREQNKEFNVKDERWENAVNDLPDPTGEEGSTAVLRFLSAWLNNDEVKRKRGYHRALCHFKICNMGSKRSNSWDMWRNNPQ